MNRRSSLEAKDSAMNGRPARRRTLAFLAAAAVILYMAYNKPFFGLFSPKGIATPPQILAVDRRSAEETLDPPIIPLQLQNPLYNIRVLRSVLQHSNTTWQEKPEEARGYFVQSLMWMQVIDGVRPKKPGSMVQAKCRFPDSDPTDRNRFYLTEARIHALETHPGDRNIGHHFAFYVDCELPQVWQSRPHGVQDVTMALTMEAGILHTDTVPGKGGNITMIVGSGDIPLPIHPPMQEHSEFAVCLSPLTYKLENAPLAQLLEWRMYMADIGVERVNWYSRDASFSGFVDAYLSKKGGKDTFKQVPHLIWHPDRTRIENWEKYSDQDAWYMDCIMRNALSSDFILVIDTDEFPMVDWRQANPLAQFKDFMRSTHPSKGSIEFDRIGMARPSERGPPKLDEMVQSQYDCFNRRDKISKSVYRSKAIFALNQHKPRQRYPMPADIAANTIPKPRPHQDYSWQTVHSYEPEVWPKMFHYRWYNWKEADVCTDASPVSAVPAYQEYLARTSIEVEKLVSHIEQTYQ